MINLILGFHKYYTVFVEGKHMPIPIAKLL
jgi:hypothetical protein